MHWQLFGNSPFLPSQIKQQIAKEYDQIKDIQRTLSEMSLDLQNSQFASKLKTTQYNDDEPKDPSLWFRPDPDIWTPPPKDPDVWAPPKIEKFVQSTPLIVDIMIFPSNDG